MSLAGCWGKVTEGDVLAGFSLTSRNSCGNRQALRGNRAALPNVFYALYGADLRAWRKSWAVRDPKLKAVPDADAKTRYVFGMKLACTMSEYARQFGGCDVDVCYMKKK